MKLSKEMKTPWSWVGLSHLLCDSGLLKLLSTKGYKIEMAVITS
jgi:hypothetical protein